MCQPSYCPVLISASSTEREASMPATTVNVRYMVDDVERAVAWYTTHLGFTLLSNAAPAFADVTLGTLRLLLSGPKSSAGRPMPDGERPGPGGWNRIHLIVDDLASEVARLRAAGSTSAARLRNALRVPGTKSGGLGRAQRARTNTIYCWTLRAGRM
jgi:catechol 2,3-dioxygenase-like lactoylglutathione lyase family enzyme